VKTILLVDDDPDVRDVLVALLAEPGYEVVPAMDGYEALRILDDRPIDVLITDVKMPGITGFELARQAKLKRPNLPIMYMSGNEDATRDAHGPAYGRVLRKPFRAIDLLVEVTRALRLTPPDPTPC
jgi:CheY-like chemotaxis protein